MRPRLIERNPIEAIYGPNPETQSNACTTSSTKSSPSSITTLNLTSLSSMPMATFGL
jgi:hypothetical protein